MEYIYCPKCKLALKKINEGRDVDNFKCPHCHLSITIEDSSTPMTVNDLIEKLNEIKDAGMGERFVMLPNVADTYYEGDSFFLHQVTTNDMTKHCIYLEGGTADQDDKWEDEYI